MPKASSTPRSSAYLNALSQEIHKKLQKVRSRDEQNSIDSNTIFFSFPFALDFLGNQTGFFFFFWFGAGTSFSVAKAQLAGVVC